MPVNLRGVVYSSGMRAGGQEEFDFLFNRYKLSDRTAASEAARCLSALSNARAPWLLRRLLDYTLDTNMIRSQVCLMISPAHCDGNCLCTLRCRMRQR